MNQHNEKGAMENVNTIIGSSLSNSPVTAGSHAKISVSSGSQENPELETAIDELRQALREAEADIDRHDDETRESLALASSRLTALEAELTTEQPKRDWSRVTRLMTGIRDALTGLTGLTVSADALMDAVEKVLP